MERTSFPFISLQFAKLKNQNWFFVYHTHTHTYYYHIVISFSDCTELNEKKMWMHAYYEYEVAQSATKRKCIQCVSESVEYNAIIQIIWKKYMWCNQCFVKIFIYCLLFSLYFSWHFTHKHFFTTPVVVVTTHTHLHSRISSFFPSRFLTTQIMCVIVHTSTPINFRWIAFRDIVR